MLYSLEIKIFFAKVLLNSIQFSLNSGTRESAGFTYE